MEEEQTRIVSAPPTVIRACDACRRKKRRCKPTEDGCEQCTKLNTACHFTPIATKRKPRRPAGFKYIAQLEERLSEVENALGTQASTKVTMPTISSHEIHEIFDIPPNDTAIVPSRQVRNDNVQMTGIFETPSIDRLARSPWMPSRAAPLSRRQQLPTKLVALELVRETLKNYNRYLPLFDENSFLSEFEFKYTTSDPKDVSWWARLNVVLAMGHRLRALRMVDPNLENSRACIYTQNALEVVSELNVSCLSSVQALLGTASILQGTANSEPASMLVAAALRLAQAMNLHREFPNENLSAAEAEIRRRVFWRVYVLDKDISLRTNRPFGQDDEDMDVKLPSDTGYDSCKVELFNHLIGLAMIQGQTYKQLYSVRAERQSAAERAASAQSLVTLLCYWKTSTGMDVVDWSAGNPDQHSAVSHGHHFLGEMTYRVTLRLTYIHCLTMIDRHLPPSKSSNHQQLLGIGETTPAPTAMTCLEESRKALQIAGEVPQEDSSCVWIMLDVFKATASILLDNIMHNPMDINADADLQLVQPFLRLLQNLSQGLSPCSRSDEVSHLHWKLSKSLDEARSAIYSFRLESLEGLVPFI